MQQTSSILPPSGPQKKPQYSSSEASDEEDEEEDIRDLEGRTYTKMGREVCIKVGGLDCVDVDYCLVQVVFFMLWVIGMLFIQLRELSQAVKAYYHSPLFTDISGQCWQCEEVQGGD